MVRSDKNAHFSMGDAPEVGRRLDTPDTSGIAKAIERSDVSTSYATRAHGEFGVYAVMPLLDESDIGPGDLPEFLR